MKDLLKELKETAQTWNKGIEEHVKITIPFYLIDHYQGKEDAYKEAGEQLLRIIKKFEK